MPLYDYRCTSCGHEVEVTHSVHGTGPETCERCGGPMRKALSTPAIHFKGSGWAKKDARSASASGRGPAGEAGATAAGSGTDTATGSSSGDAATPSSMPSAAGKAAADTTG